MDASKKPNVFIRGIYSTALTRLFLDAGYPIIFPSQMVQKRFNIPFRPADNYSKDITITDRHDRQGVSIMFKKKIYEQLEANNFADFPLCQASNPDLIVQKARFQKNSIYRGLVIRSNKQKNFSHIRLIPQDIGSNGIEEENIFQTTLGRYARFLEDGKEGIFQVTHEDSGKIRAALGSYYTIPGDLIVINPYNTKVIISREITNGQHKKRLFDLGKSIQQTKKYGFIFRTAAELATDEEIIDEVNQLEKDLIETQNIITKFPERMGEIYSNYVSMNVIFPTQIKMMFDKIRGKEVATVDSHHSIKSALITEEVRREKPELFESNYLGAILEYTESIMDIVESTARPKISTNFLNQYYKVIKPRKELNINHMKLNCKTIFLTPGFIQKVEFKPEHPLKLTLKRRLRSGGIYDGLGTPIESGDYATATYEEGSWFYVSQYFSKTGELKGKYFNINTPIEITASGIRYIDLEVDVVENMVGEKKIIDNEYLEQAYKLGIISEDVYVKAKTLSENILAGKIF